ncbi:MAG: hypothetical protein M1840_002424 [Geoglossum simile]|nr:MAG: hypothetical protein M1840_002424 [Geoglossum simile]
MDTARYLKTQGWLGTGHALSIGKGLSKPLLISRKSDVLGVGKKHNQADQWWARAFDDSLSGLEVQEGDVGADGVREVKVTQTKKGGVLEGLVAGKGSLYSMFVKGEGLVGTIGKGTMEDETAENRREAERGHTGEDRRKLQKGKSSGAVGEIAASNELEPWTNGCMQRPDTRPLEPLADKSYTSKYLGLKRERRRGRREIKALRLSKRGDLPAESASPGTSHQSEGGDPGSRASSADEESRQARKLRKKVEKSSDTGLTSKSARHTGGGDAVTSKNARKKKRKLAL